MDTPIPQPDDATYADLNPHEVEWLKINLDWLGTAGWDGTAAGLGTLMDGLFDAWAQAGEMDRPDPNEMVNAFGIGLGDILNRELGSRWQVYTDSQGGALACYLDEKKVTLFPVSSVARKFEAGDRGWVEPFVATTVQQVREISQM